MSSARFDTTPDCVSPARPLIQRAKEAVPATLNVLPNHPSGTAPQAPHRVVTTSGLTQKLGEEGHRPDAVQWAIHELIQEGKLEVEGAWLPGVPWVAGDPHRFSASPPSRRYQPSDFRGPVPFHCFLVRSTDALWDWWRTLDDSSRESDHAGDSAPEGADTRKSVLSPPGAGPAPKGGSVSERPRLYPRSSGPIHQDWGALNFMIFWERELRTGTGRHGQPDHYPLPEQGDTDNDRAALRLLRACCANYWEAEGIVLPFLNAPWSSQNPILERMKAITGAARLAAARAALHDGPPTGDEGSPLPDTNQAQAGGPEGIDAGRDQAKTPPPEEERTGNGQDEKQAKPLSPLQYDILDALRNLRATDPEKRATGQAIADRVGGDATGQSVKAPLADLKQQGYVDSQTGRNGGSWLTAVGLDLINALRPKL